MVTPKKAQRPRPRRVEPDRMRPARSFWHDLAAIGERIPDADLEFIPKDAAARFDEYFDGANR